MNKKHDYPKPEKPDFPHIGLKDWLTIYYLKDNDITCCFHQFVTDGTYLWYKDDIICTKLCWVREPIFCYQDGEGDSYQVCAIEHIIDYCEEWYANSECVLMPFSETKNYTNIWDIDTVAANMYWRGIEEAAEGGVRLIK